MPDASMRAVAVTGASGFIGRHLIRHLAKAGHRVHAITRAPLEHVPPDIESFATGDLERAREDVLDRALAGVSAVVHLAGRAHVLEDHDANPEKAYRVANAEATARLVAAARARVERFVLVSTVKVSGESTAPGRPFHPDDPPAPADDYARSKGEAERIALDAFDGVERGAVILRLPLVYGPGVRGNFARLMEAIASERTLPLAAIHNRRSIAYVGNVCSAVAAVLAASASVRGIHFVADATSVSTPHLVRAIAAAMNTPVHLAYVPLPLLRIAATLAGKRAELDRVVGSLEVDTSTLRERASWHPPHTTEEGIAHTAAWWRVHHSI